MLSSDQAAGCLLGVALADALGATFEGVDRDTLQNLCESPDEVWERSLTRQQLRYTDDGQMTLALAEYLCRFDNIDPRELMRDFTRAYEVHRGYGRGARTLIEAFRDQADYEFMAAHLFPGGSLGNGAAMRAAPVGLRFADEPERLWEQARLSAWPTHRHPLGIEGAQLIALGTSYAIQQTTITPRLLAEHLLPCCQTAVFQREIEQLAELADPSEIAQFGNGIEAHESVVTALACFAVSRDDYPTGIRWALWQGGDTDTIAAMTGGLLGAHLGRQAIPTEPLSRLEDGENFVEYVAQLADRLAATAA